MELIYLAIPWYVAVFESFPEAILIMATGFSLFHINVSTKHIFFIAVISAVTSYLVRKLPLLFGVHSLIAALIFIVLSMIIARVGFWPSVVSVLAGMVVLGILQSLMLPIIKTVAYEPYNKLHSEPWYNIVFFVPQALVMIYICYFCSKKGWYLYDLHTPSKSAIQK